jgi:3-phenylpropionate/trans-cinnamate dioxygenase ferredoxin reductase subunit
MNESEEVIVIVGGGHAGAQACASLVEAGQGARVQLVCDEPELPYQRPPLSKAFLKDAQTALQPHRGAVWYAEHGIAVHLGDKALAIDRERKRLVLASGRELAYDRLVLATGARARRLPLLAEGVTNLFELRSAADAQRLRERLATAKRLTVLGGGFIGLEVAATARALGLEVDVIESLPRLLSRSVSPELAAHVQASHEAAGVRLRLGASVASFEVEANCVQALRLADGERWPVELLLQCVGAVPDTTLAQRAGLDLANGIVVDACMRTSDPAILAIGDCCNFPEHASGRRLRLESVQNATDQARTAVATLLGREEPYRALPWFWSEQGGLRLQMAGLMPAAGGTRHRRAGASAASFSIAHYDDASARLVCVESANAPLDHVMSRKLLEAGACPAPERFCDAAVALKSLL